jgi:hypothetical protein
MKTDEELRGVAGWLALLVAGLTVLGPLMALAQTSNEISIAEASNPLLESNPLWAQVKLVSWVSTFLGCGVSIFAGITLGTNHRIESVRIAIACLWFGGLGIAIATLAIMGEITGGDAFGQPEAISGLVRSVFTAGIWTAYLKFSRRVRVTYNVTDEPETTPSVGDGPRFNP